MVSWSESSNNSIKKCPFLSRLASSTCHIDNGKRSRIQYGIEIIARVSTWSSASRTHHRSVLELKRTKKDILRFCFAGAWIITGGMNMNVMKLIGEIVQSNPDRLRPIHLIVIRTFLCLFLSRPNHHPRELQHGVVSPIMKNLMYKVQWYIIRSHTVVDEVKHH